MAKFGTSSSIGLFATTGDGYGVHVGTGDGPRASIRDEDGVDVGTRDDPHAPIRDEYGLTSVEGEDGVGATSKDLISIDIVDGDMVDDGRLSLGGSSLTIYRFFFPIVPFPLESCDRGQGGSTPLMTYLYIEKIILQIINQIEYWDELKLDN